MYDLAEIRWATDALWEAVAARLLDMGIDAPATLTRGDDLHAIWTDPRLLLAQTCGYPLITSLKDRVRLVATPCYDAPGCEAANYRSVVVVRTTDPARTLADLRGRRCAVNSMDSNSGMNLLRAAVAPWGTPFWSDTVLTGAHTASVAAVSDGRADAAAIDCVTWAHLQHLRPHATQKLRVLASTKASPGLPLITSVQTGQAAGQALLRALEGVTGDPALAPVRQALRLKGFMPLPLSAYDAIPT